MKLEKFLSERVAELPESQIAEIIRIAEEDKTVISLGPGEPDFTTPKSIRAIAKKSLDKGLTHYSPPCGMKELIEAVNEKLRKENKIKLENPEKQVIVTNGSTEGILLANLCLIDAGQEMLVPDPGFLVYKPCTEMMQGFAMPYNLSDKDGFQIHIEEIEKKINPHSRAIVINSPSNPTGTVLKKKVLEEIASIAIEHKLLIISDEAYEHFVFEKAKHYSIASLNGMQEQVLSLFSCSKSFAMPGFRIGYAVGPEWLINKMVKTHVYTTLCASPFSQRAAAFALKGSRKEVWKMQKEYAKRRKAILKGLENINGLHIEVKPEGAFYVFPKITINKTSNEMAKFLLEKAKVLTVPGTEFGSNGEGFLRLSYATSMPKIKEALERMEKALGKTQPVFR